ncbi:MAG: MFS transporter [bacterium]
MPLYIINRTFSSLKNNNFRLFFSGQLVSLIGTWMQQTALGWLIYEMTGSKALLGFVAAISAFPMLVFSLFGGAIADRYPKRKILVTVQIFAMIMAFILAFLQSTHIIHIWHIMFISLLLGIALAIDIPVRQSFFIDIVGKEDLMNAVALNSSLVNAARMIGPMVAGAIMVQFGILWCFILNGFSFIAVILALLKLKLSSASKDKPTNSILKSIKEGFVFVKHNKPISRLMILMIVMVVFGTAYSTLLPAIAKDLFHKGEKGYAMLASANGVGSLIGALIIAYIGGSAKKKYLINGGIFVFAITLILLALTTNFYLALLFLCISGIGIVSYFSATTTIIQQNVDDEYRGRVMGIWALVFGGMVPLGNLFGGVVAQYIGIKITLIICALVCMLFATYRAIYTCFNDDECLCKVQKVISDMQSPHE